MINTNKLAEQAGLLGPASRVGDAHAATERFAILHRAEIIAELTQGVEMPEPYAHLCLLPTKDAGPTKFFTAPSDPRGFAVYTADQLRETVAAAVLREREAGKSATVEALLRIEKESDLLCANFDALKAENERLREALEEMLERFKPHAWGSDGNQRDALNAARAALKGQL